MKIVVLNSNDKKGVTYNLKNIFLEEFKDSEIQEFYLTNDLNKMCIGCTTCFTKGEQYCKDYENVNKINSTILESDLIVFAYPTYVFHCPASIKNLLDHLGYQWIVHRPNKLMFQKRAVIIPQCLGAEGKNAIKDVKDSLSWWGIPKIYTYNGAIRDKDIIWENISNKRKNNLTKAIKNLVKK